MSQIPCRWHVVCCTNSVTLVYFELCMTLIYAVGKYFCGNHKSSKTHLFHTFCKGINKIIFIAKAINTELWRLDKSYCLAVNGIYYVINMLFMESQGKKSVFLSFKAGKKKNGFSLETIT